VSQTLNFGEGRQRREERRRGNQIQKSENFRIRSSGRSRKSLYFFGDMCRKNFSFLGHRFWKILLLLLVTKTWTIASGTIKLFYTPSSGNDTR
jgi:hypothetical protein